MDHLNEAPTRIRRSDREVVDETWMKRLLKTAALGTMATVRAGQLFQIRTCLSMTNPRQCRGR